jgi:hypothetical protein
VEVKRLFFAVILAIIFIGLPILGLSDTVISSDYTASPNNEVAGSVSKASNSSGSASITITMTGTLDE